MSMVQDDAGFGCAAFGHLASAFVDGELPRTELDRFATHLPGCGECQRLVAQYRALDAAAMPPYPRPAEAEWASAWGGIRAAIESDRAEAASSPAAGLLRFRSRLARPWVAPLAAAVAVATLVAITLAVRGTWVVPEVPDEIATHPPVRPAAVTAAAAGSEILSVTCLAGWEPVVWTLDGDDPMTVVQCQPTEA
jgi:anti-sigma factor RsiW